MNKSSYIALALLGAVSFNQASAAVITFNGLGGTHIPGAFEVNPGFTAFQDNTKATIGGFYFETLLPLSSSNSSSNGWAILGLPPGTGDDSSLAWNGTDILISVRELSISQVNGETFALNGLDLAHYGDLFGSGDSVTIVGNFAGGGSIMKNLATPPIINADLQVGNDFTSFALTGFNNLNSVSITGNGSFFAFALDNLNISTVPEPGTLAIIMAGLLPLGFALRRRRQEA
jgi:hypothetical protein